MNPNTKKYQLKLTDTNSPNGDPFPEKACVRKMADKEVEEGKEQDKKVEEGKEQDKKVEEGKEQDKKVEEGKLREHFVFTAEVRPLLCYFKFITI